MKKEPLTIETLEEHLADAMVALLKIAKESAWNKISDNCLFILSEDDDSNEGWGNRSKNNKRINDRKKPKQLAELMPEMIKLYSGIYDINLVIYRSTEKNDGDRNKILPKKLT